MSSTPEFRADKSTHTGANIELKARLASLDAARQIARDVATESLGTEHQKDTYFHSPGGRLKLREIEGRPAQLVAYDRPNTTQPKESAYELVPVPDPEGLKRALTRVLGIRAVVDKQREIFLYHNVRIHLDQVVGLGAFLEFEAVLGGRTEVSKF
jgi:adenylate cyclase class 2